jgi:hypothetical protein
MMAKVAFTAENMKMCICPGCPVQSASACVKEQAAVLKETLKSNPLKADKIPGLYCASGVATCKDIDFKKPCICNSCVVYAQNKLKGGKPLLFFCRDGVQ